ncbi:hypothetical protein OA530_02410 [Pelagibacteraceae bacterium]|nr:hypothetical protein [Pelagibacteraceae bacterium]
MSQKKADTDQILDAIKNMMSDSATVNQELPKDVVELTAPIDEEVSQSSANTDVLELTELVSDSKEVNKEEAGVQGSDIISPNIIEDDQIRSIVRKSIESIPASKLDQIINEELTNVIQDRINNSKIVIASKNNDK